MLPPIGLAVVARGAHAFPKPRGPFTRRQRKGTARLTVFALVLGAPIAVPLARQRRPLLGPRVFHGVDHLGREPE
jgi:hypothetical protein